LLRLHGFKGAFQIILTINAQPISFDLETIDECMKEVEKAGVQLILGFQRRFDDNFRSVRKAIEAGTIGEVRTFHITSRDPSPPPADYLKNSGGIFNDMVSHDFDMARFLAGDGAEVDEIFVTARAFDKEAAEANDFDTTNTMIRFTNGVFGTIENSRRCAFGYDQRVEVFGREGAVSGLNRAPTSVSTSTASGIGAPLPYSFFMDRYADAYVNIMNAFVQCVQNRDDEEFLRQQRPAFAEDGKMCILLALAAEKSARTNRPIKIKDVIAEKYGEQ
jgi:myo-inositol 2-dehydrogenase/D-chiro-inositol 1-dehydrogenase